MFTAIFRKVCDPIVDSLTGMTDRYRSAAQKYFPCVRRMQTKDRLGQLGSPCADQSGNTDYFSGADFKIDASNSSSLAAEISKFKNRIADIDRTFRKDC